MRNARGNVRWIAFTAPMAFGTLLVATILGTGCVNGALQSDESSRRGSDAGATEAGGDAGWGGEAGRPDAGARTDSSATSDASQETGGANGECRPGDTRPCGSSTGICKAGTQSCRKDGTWGACKGRVRPEWDETCDSQKRDEDCDGTANEGCNCKPKQKRPCGTSKGVCRQGTQHCKNGTWTACKGAVKPSTETCDGKDNDCDGNTDESHGTTTFYRDADGDGYGDASTTKTDCAPPQGYATKKGDCANWDASIHPGANETCNGKDDDCDGKTDESSGLTCFEDADGDGYGDSSDTVQVCATSCSSQGRASKGGDCDDSDADAHPGAAPKESGSGCYVDEDGDGYGDASVFGNLDAGSDCDDGDADIHPDGDADCDGKDNDCDGSTDEIEPVQGVSITTTHRAREHSIWHDHKKRVVSTATNSGVCAAFLHKDNEVQFAHVEADGSVTRKRVSVPGQGAAELFTMASSGNNCAMIYRRKMLVPPNDDLYLARWNPSSPNTYEEVQLTTDSFNSTKYRHATGLEYIVGTGWVAAYVETPWTSHEELRYVAVPDSFTSSTKTNSKLIYKISLGLQHPNPSLDVGRSVRWDHDFDVAVRGNWSSGNWPDKQLRVFGVGGSAGTSEYKQARIAPAGGLAHPELIKIEGVHYLTYHDDGSDEMHVRELLDKGVGGKSTVDYGDRGTFSSASSAKRVPTNLAGGGKFLGNWLIDPHDGDWATFERNSSGIHFDSKSHRNIDPSDELRTVFADIAKDRLWVFTLTDTSKYETEMNAYTCY